MTKFQQSFDQNLFQILNLKLCFRSGEVLRRQPANSGSEGGAAGGAGGSCEGAAAGDQPQGHRLQHLCVLGSKVIFTVSWIKNNSFKAESLRFIRPVYFLSQSEVRTLPVVGHVTWFLFRDLKQSEEQKTKNQRFSFQISLSGLNETKENFILLFNGDHIDKFFTHIERLSVLERTIRW